MINGPMFSHHINRIQPVDGDRQDDSQHEQKKRRVRYQGRAWAEAEEDDLPVQPSIPRSPSPTKSSPSSSGVYADRVLLERAQALFSHLTTLEEKAAQLCFLATDAVYDAALQHEVELLIQTWQIGGVLFRKGDYRRQTYLIERYQDVSKTPLLISNDFLHGLSFYLQGDTLPNGISEKHFSDLGKAVMVQNRRLGVHIQFDRQRGSDKLQMNEEQAKAFRKGIRGAQGIVGKEKVENLQDSYSQSKKGTFPFLSLKDRPILSTVFSEHQVQETIGFKTLTFFDATEALKSGLEEKILEGFQKLYDVFLFSGNIAEAIRAIAKLVRSGKIAESVLDRHLMKALIIKSLFFK